MAFPTRLIEAKTTLNPAQIDLLPFHIEYNGVAPVSTYFMRRSCPAELAQGPGELVSAFRGRDLHGTPITLPRGYQGRVMKVSAPAFVRSRPARAGNGAPTRKRPVPGSAPIGADAKKRRTSPRKAKMVFSLDSSPPASPTKSTSPSKDPARSTLEVEMTTHLLPTSEPAGEIVTKTESVTAIEEIMVEPMSMAPDVQTSIDLEPIYSFETFTLWTPDAVPVDRGSDPYVRALDEWTALSHLVHLIDTLWPSFTSSSPLQIHCH